MRKTVLIPLLVLLAGCATYYDPSTGPSGSVYYVSADPGYPLAPANYAHAAHYPWWSLDHFYFGSGYHGSGFSLGLNFGSPYYGWHGYFYDPWYRPYRYAGWYPPYYRYPFYGHPYYRYPYYGHSHPHYRYFRPHPHGQHRRPHHPPSAGHGNADHERAHGRHRQDYPGSSEPPAAGYDPDLTARRGPGAAGSSRFVTVAPSATGGDRAVVIRRQWTTKPGPSRPHDTETPGVSAADHNGRESGGSVYRSPSYRDPGRQHRRSDAGREPARGRPETGSAGAMRSPRPDPVIRTIDVPGRPVMTIRAPARGKGPAPQRPQPIVPQPHGRQAQAVRTTTVAQPRASTSRPGAQRDDGHRPASGAATRASRPGRATAAGSEGRRRR